VFLSPVVLHASKFNRVKIEFLLALNFATNLGEVKHYGSVFKKGKLGVPSC
jgi:hypothetical protein